MGAAEGHLLASFGSDYIHSLAYNHSLQQTPKNVALVNFHVGMKKHQGSGMSKRKRKLTPAEKAEKKRRRLEYMTIFINGKQKRVKRPTTIKGMEVDELIRRNAGPWGANKVLKAEPSHAGLIVSLSLWLIGGVLRSA